jgi:hypothetical protein
MTDVAIDSAAPETAAPAPSPAGSDGAGAAEPQRNTDGAPGRGSRSRDQVAMSLAASIAAVTDRGVTERPPVPGQHYVALETENQ